MKKILITGVAGFIGFHTAKQLIAKGYSVVGIDNLNNYYDPEIKINRIKSIEGLKFYKMDLNDDIDQVFKENKIDAVIHIAASAGVRPSIDNPLYFVKNNILVTTKILDKMREYGISNIVFASSSSVYGNIIENTSKAIKESDIKDDIYSPYAATKLSCEKMISTYTNLYQFKSVSLRYFTVFGPDQRPDLAIIKFMKSTIDGSKIDKYGIGETFRDYTYIGDIVNANILALESNFKSESRHEIVNISSNNPISLNELIAKIENVVGKKANVNQMGMQLGDVYGTFGDNSKAKKIFGWEPQTTFDNGLINTFNWIKEKERD